MPLGEIEDDLVGELSRGLFAVIPVRSDTDYPVYRLPRAV